MEVSVLSKKAAKRMYSLIGVIVALICAISAWFVNRQEKPEPLYTVSLSEVPAFSNEPYVVLYDNEPFFEESDLSTASYEYYSPLDELDRCGYAMACIGPEMMPEEERGSISSVTPSGWVQAQYAWVEAGNLYNRCHLIGYQLTGENANKQNLITGTRYCNIEGMLPFENQVAGYIRQTGNHVLYRVTPIFAEDELVARGIQMEAWSVEDEGEGICFHVYVYNNQPGVVIDYATGYSYADGEIPTTVQTDITGDNTYILNINSKKFHLDSCEQGASIKDSNRDTYSGDRSDLIEEGYVPAKCCNP